MNVKTALPRIDKLRQIMNGRHGLLLTSDLASSNIPRTYLSIIEQNGEIEQVSRGVYRSVSAFIEDELFSFQSRYSSTIFSHETALYLHDLTDRAPLTYSISAPPGYHSQFLNTSEYKILASIPLQHVFTPRWALQSNRQNCQSLHVIIWDTRQRKFVAF